MERLHQLQRDGKSMNAAGSDDNVSALLNGKLEVMVIGIVERTILPIIEPLIRQTGSVTRYMSELKSERKPGKKPRKVLDGETCLNTSYVSW